MHLLNGKAYLLYPPGISHQQNRYSQKINSLIKINQAKHFSISNDIE
jgi:hypothetical protein